MHLKCLLNDNVLNSELLPNPTFFGEILCYPVNT